MVRNNFFFEHRFVSDTSGMIIFVLENSTFKESFPFPILTFPNVITFDVKVNQ